MKSHLVHILPVWRACEILGEPVVRRMVSGLLHLRQNSAALKLNDPDYDVEQDIHVLTRALCYRHDYKSSLPPEIAHAWKRWLSARNLALDKATLINFVVPNTVQPHSGPSGHMGLFDCWVYALQGHGITSSNTAYYAAGSNALAGTLVWLPDVLILLAAAKNFADFCEQPREQQQPINDEDKGDNAAFVQIGQDTPIVSGEANPQDGKGQQGDCDDDHDHDVSNKKKKSPVEKDQPRKSPRSSPVPERNSLTKPKSAIAEAKEARDELIDSYFPHLLGEHGDGDNNNKIGETIATTNKDQYEGDGDRRQVNSGSIYNTPSPDGASDHSAVRLASSKRNVHSEGEEAVRIMAVAAFRIYDSYQKKGTVSRDTIHRFLTDVHGENSFKEESTRALLDDMFASSVSGQPTTDALHASVSEVLFVAWLVDTFDYEHGRRSHLLLDWMASLLVAMIPPEEISPSITAYLDTMEHRPKPLCEVYQIAESRLFEVKRRFHSLVRAGPMSVIQGDPMGAEVSAEGAASPTNSQHSSASNINHSLHANQQPKHTIIQAAFLDAVCKPNPEMGHGGYLPESLAKLVFLVGSRNAHGDNPNIASIGNSGGASSTQIFWGLPNFIQFGCMAVRRHLAHLEDYETPLYRFLFTVFSMSSQQDHHNNSQHDMSSPSSYLDDATPRFLTRSQVERMLLLMIEHSEFRIKMDAPENPDTSTHDEEEEVDPIKSLSSDEEGKECPLVDLEPSYLLGILPSRLNRPNKGQKSSLVPLQTLVDYALEFTADGENMTFEEFCAWNTAVPDGGPASRLGPIVMDLRLIASVLFGVPPTLASMEVSLIAEIERRHKSRYPQTSVSRRGPRGTVWYIINAEWLRSWSQRINDVAGNSEDDADDGRMEVKGGVRGLGRIENANLLTNSTLALRQEIQWKHDYEILPPLAWHALQAWYDGGPPINRSVVRYVDNNTAKSGPHSTPTASSGKSRMPTENEIELYPYFVTVYLCDSTSGGEARPFQQNYQVSRVSPVMIMLVQLCKELDVDPSMARLWVLGSTPENGPATAADGDGAKDWILSRDENIVEQRKLRLDQSQLKKDISLLLELKNRETGQWPRGKDGKEWLLREKRSAKQSQPDLGDGIVGLYNMGNTCFLNSSIQCISHTPIFREYFTSKAYLNDINTTNPLGYQGQLAQVSAVLINSLWKPFNQNIVPTSRAKRVTAPGSYVVVNAQSLTPKTFKESLGKFNDLFSGNEQHDAQEFLTFLLAGLSEDLNRIMEKPYIEAPDSDGRPDKELADIWWSNHLKRELSIVVALFQGQYKNLLTCRTCKYESARFEPFSTLTVPLPEDDSLTASVIVYPFSEDQEPTRYCVRVKSSGNLGDVLYALAKELLLDEDGGLSKDSPEQNEETSPPLGQKITGEEDGGHDRIETIDLRIGRKASDLSIVDMRDGYIFRIAPLSWSLHDLQNRETGDLPTMHCYELGALSSDAENKPGTLEEEKIEPEPRYGYLAISQRRSDLISRDYMHPLTHRLFGTPILLRLPDIDNCSGRRLYDTVAKRLRPLVPKGALRFLATPISSVEDESDKPESPEEGKESEGKPSEFGESRNVGCGMIKSLTDSEDISAGPVPRFGFRLRVTSRDGRKCLICPWYKCCVGCCISDDNTLANVMDGDSLVVDWHFAVDVATLGFGTRAGLLDPIAARPSGVIRPNRPVLNVKTHRTCGVGGKVSLTGAITLEHCLDAFAKEERIPEAYCSKCKEFRVQTTRMTLWRLPPILIIHLKRFQFTPTMRRKLRDLVVFPLEGLDLTRIAAQNGGESKRIGKVSSPKKKRGGEETVYLSDHTETTEATGPDAGRNLYDLYGVIHHQGALSGGHYVASLKSEIDGQWRLFNDAQIYEIHARDVIDCSAYILFYMRRDVAQGARLSDFWDLKQVASMSEEEMDNLVKGRSDRCVIS